MQGRSGAEPGVDRLADGRRCEAFSGVEHLLAVSWLGWASVLVLLLFVVVCDSGLKHSAEIACHLAWTLDLWIYGYGSNN